LEIILYTPHQPGGAFKPDGLKPLSLEKERYSGKVFHARSGCVPHITGKAANPACAYLSVVNRIVRTPGIMLSGLEDALVLLRRPAELLGELFKGHVGRVSVMDYSCDLIVRQFAELRVSPAEGPNIHRITSLVLLLLLFDNRGGGVER
jgi:hypothetical protein